MQKAENIMLAKPGRASDVKLMDFGLAKLRCAHLLARSCLFSTALCNCDSPKTFGCMASHGCFGRCHQQTNVPAASDSCCGCMQQR